jgi:hypothetical protein
MCQLQAQPAYEQQSKMHPNMVAKVSHIVYAKLDVIRISAAAEKQENYATASAMAAYHVQINEIRFYSIVM